MPASIKKLFLLETLKESHEWEGEIFQELELVVQFPENNPDSLVRWIAFGQSKRRMIFRLFEWISQVEGFTYLRNDTSAPSQGIPSPLGVKVGINHRTYFILMKLSFQ